MSKTKFNPTGVVLTDEQQKIVMHPFKKGDCVCIKAFAGTGKTFTLQYLSNIISVKKPSWKILYLAFSPGGLI